MNTILWFPKLSTSFLFLLLYVTILSCVPPNNEKTATQSSTPKKSEMEATLAYKIEAKLGEGAFWNHETQEFYWVDIEGKKLHIYQPSLNTNRSLETPSRVGTVVPMNTNESVIALEDGLYKINTQTGVTSLIAAVEADRPDNRFNDGKCDPMGRLWAGTMSMVGQRKAGSLYRVEPNGTVSKQLDSISTSNGIVWTADQQTMYYIDTGRRNIRAFDYNPASGDITNERVAVSVPDSLGYPDGMAIDEHDMLWVGMWGGQAVAHFNPKTGQLVQKIKVPALNVTACAFGGPNLDTLYITTARQGMKDAQFKEFPDAGSIFKAVPGVKGVKSAFFKHP